MLLQIEFWMQGLCWPGTKLNTPNETSEQRQTLAVEKWLVSIRA